jgi:hypothetical protein
LGLNAAVDERRRSSYRYIVSVTLPPAVVYQSVAIVSPCLRYYEATFHIGSFCTCPPFSEEEETDKGG